MGDTFEEEKVFTTFKKNAMEAGKKATFKRITGADLKRMDREYNIQKWNEINEKYYALEQEITTLLNEYEKTREQRNEYSYLVRKGKYPPKYHFSLGNKIEWKIFGKLLMEIWAFLFLSFMALVFIVGIMGIVIRIIEFYI